MVLSSDIILNPSFLLFSCKINLNDSIPYKILRHNLFVVENLSKEDNHPEVFYHYIMLEPAQIFLGLYFDCRLFQIYLLQDQVYFFLLEFQQSYQEAIPSFQNFLILKENFLTRVNFLMIQIFFLPSLQLIV